MPDRPEAILAANSLLSVGALEAIRELNLAIPDDIALVGFDETTWTMLVQPTLTVIAQPTYEIGQTAMDYCSNGSNSPMLLPDRLSSKGNC